MKLWIDDLRTPPDDTWTWAKTSKAALKILRKSYGTSRGVPGYSLPDANLEAVSFDHDLGGEDTSRRVMMWMAEFEYWPDEVSVHTMNNVGREWLLGTANRYAPSRVEIFTRQVG